MQPQPSINPAAVEIAKELLRASGYYVKKIWHARDIQLLCQQLELPEVSNAAAMEVFDIADEQFDGEYGISWPQLEKALRTYLERQKVLSSMCETDSA